MLGLALAVRGIDNGDAVLGALVHRELDAVVDQLPRIVVALGVGRIGVADLVIMAEALNAGGGVALDGAGDELLAAWEGLFGRVHDLEQRLVLDMLRSCPTFFDEKIERRVRNILGFGDGERHFRSLRLS